MPKFHSDGDSFLQSEYSIEPQRVSPIDKVGIDRNWGDCIRCGYAGNKVVAICWTLDQNCLEWVPRTSMFLKEFSELERANWAVMADGEKPSAFNSLGQFARICEGLGRDPGPPVSST